MGLLFQPYEKIKVKKDPQFSTYLWGPIEEISGKTLKLMEKNKFGDCLCFSDKGLVDIDHRDVEGNKNE